MKPTPELAERLQAILALPGYRLAYEGAESLTQDDLRPQLVPRRVVQARCRGRLIAARFRRPETRGFTVVTAERCRDGRVPGNVLP